MTELSPAAALGGLSKSESALAQRQLDTALGAGRPTQHGLSSKNMALVTSDCGTTRSLSIKWPVIPSGWLPRRQAGGPAADAGGPAGGGRGGGKGLRRCLSSPLMVA